MNAPTPGWNPDPTGRHEYRYWDGASWTDDVSDSGVTSVDPMAGAPAGAPYGSEPTAPFEPTAPYDPNQAYGTPAGQPGPDPYGGPPGPGGPGGYGTYSSGQFPPAQPPKSGPPTGLIVGIAVVVVVAIVGAIIALSGGDDDDTATDDDTTTTEETEDTTEDTTSEGETTDVFEIGVGDCLSDSASVEGEVSDVERIDCSQPHGFEVYHSYIIEGDTFPGTSEMETIAGEECTTAFESFVGIPYSDSIYYFQYLSPTEESWEGGDRELLCMVYNPDGPTTGSLAGAAE